MDSWGLKFWSTSGAKISELSKINPSWAKRVGAFQGLFNYAQSLSSTNKTRADAVKNALEIYVSELEKTTETLKLYTDEEKKASKLYQEVCLGFLACDKWMQNVDKKKEPRELAESLPRKTGRLHNYIQLECVENLSAAQRAFDKLVAEAVAKGEAKHPLVYYKNGKDHLEKMEWVEAKQCFLNYEQFALAGDKRCRKPEEDNFYYWLSYIEEKMIQQKEQAQDPILSVINVRDNKYEVKLKEWRAKHTASDSALLSIRKVTSPEDLTPKKPKPVSTKLGSPSKDDPVWLKSGDPLSPTPYLKKK